MKEKILGFPQKRALELGLDVTDLILYDIVAHSHKNAKLEKLECDGKTYTRIKYDSLIEFLPILRLKKRALGNRLAKLCEVGLIEKHTTKDNRLATYFRTNDVGDVSVMTSACHENDVPYTNRSTNLEKKEKDINKFISKKKEEKSSDFDSEMAIFRKSVGDDHEFHYSLRSYGIKDIGALVAEFKSHILHGGMVGDFMRNGYQRNKMWLLRAIPKMDITKAVGLTLGKGEYMKDGKRYYIHPTGVEREVPIDAPPRQLTSQVWYVDEKRWGPQL